MAIRRQKKKKKVPEGTPEEIKLFGELCKAIESSGIETRVERGNFRGGICTVEGEKDIFFINKKHSMSGRIAVILEELKKNDMLNTLPDPLIAKVKSWF